ncbi:MAG: polysaccharide pyruvyl transferase family protein [Prevotella sp.]
MKIGILTFHCAVNYGAVLQTYGLCQCLQRMGHEVYVIDYRPAYLLKPYKVFSLNRFVAQRCQPIAKRVLRELLAMPTRLSRQVKFRHFITRNIPLVQLDLQHKKHDFDAFVFGSDQIWNPYITQLDPVFFAEAPAFQDAKRITYAASAGSPEHLRTVEASDMNLWLNNFQALSVREPSLAHFLKENYGVEASVHIDPVLFAGKSIMDTIVSPIRYRRPYALLFTLEDFRSGLPIVEKIAKERNLEVKIAVSSLVTLKANHVMQSLSVGALLGYFKNAAYIVTSSFHGTVLSLLFEKEFTAFYDSEKVGERIIDLLATLGLKDRIYTSDGQMDKPIDWKKVNEKIESKRREAYHYFQQAFNQAI